MASTVTVLTQATDTALAAGNAISTTTNVAASTGNGQCVHPSAPDPINCNAYAAKADVWLSNLPGALGDGNYYFSVLAPGSQANPNDGSPGLLSTDLHTARTFNVTGGVVTSTGTHLSENNRMQLFDFADTPNPGGVYIAAVCKLAAYPATASDCKYDAFKVGPGSPNAEPLEILKDATGQYTRTYHWNITKVADKTLITQAGGNAVFNYTVGVTHDAGTVSAVSVSGTISVFNPNNDPVTGVNVTDTLSDGTVCAVTGGAAATAIPGDNDFAYTCSLPNLPAGQLDNTATASWAEQSVGGSTLLAGSADFTFTGINFTGAAVDDCVTVTDTVAGLLGSRCVGDANEGVPFTYQRNIPVVPNCTSYPNTATFVADDTGATGSANASVTVCGPLATGAHTIGFWQNKNGQGIIKGGTAPGGVCASGTYLRTFAPFKDLSATATCATVASYYLGVFDAANGAVMNKMLKAQMLATALDVYFTGTGSTVATQKFLPHSNLGNVVIDLTKICTNIPTCSSFQNVSSAFGGAASLKVGEMLTYAGLQSNSGGSTWYANVKATQTLAKNAFDAINNQVVFAP